MLYREASAQDVSLTFEPPSTTPTKCRWNSDPLSYRTTLIKCFNFCHSPRSYRQGQVWVAITYNNSYTPSNAAKAVVLSSLFTYTISPENTKNPFLQHGIDFLFPRLNPFHCFSNYQKDLTLIEATLFFLSKIVSFSDYRLMFSHGSWEWMLQGNSR